MLQIETNAVTGQNHHKGACPLCGGGVLGEELHRGVVGGVLVGVVEGFER